MAGINDNFQAGHPIVGLFDAIKRGHDIDHINVRTFWNFIRQRANMSRDKAGYHHIKRAFNKNNWANMVARQREVFAEITSSRGEPQNPGIILVGQLVEFFKNLDNGSFDSDDNNQGDERWYQTEWGKDAIVSFKELRTLAYAKWGNDAIDPVDYALINRPQPLEEPLEPVQRVEPAQRVEPVQRVEPAQRVVRFRRPRRRRGRRDRGGRRTFKKGTFKKGTFIKSSQKRRRTKRRTFKKRSQKRRRTKSRK